MLSQRSLPPVSFATSLFRRSGASQDDESRDKQDTARVDVGGREDKELRRLPSLLGFGGKDDEEGADGGLSAPRASRPLFSGLSGGRVQAGRLLSVAHLGRVHWHAVGQNAVAESVQKCRGACVKASGCCGMAPRTQRV